MKKILSLALAALMVVSAVPMVYAADVDYTNGTAVEYTATGTEAYTVTVPAALAPGASGTVTLEGTWASNREVTVTADANVVLTNSINAQDTKTLVVTFGGITLAGDNNGAVETAEAVSVAAISDALFGTWSGKFNYNVEIANVTTVETITFEINGTEYQAEEGMTWSEWAESAYNTSPTNARYTCAYNLVMRIDDTTSTTERMFYDEAREELVRADDEIDPSVTTYYFK